MVAYLMSMVKEKWVRADMREMEYMTELALRGSGEYVFAGTEAKMQSQNKKIVSPLVCHERMEKEENYEIYEKAEKV